MTREETIARIIQILESYGLLPPPKPKSPEAPPKPPQ